jgi:polyisoprenoid-binding protein YceI
VLQRTLPVRYYSSREPTPRPASRAIRTRVAAFAHEHHRRQIGGTQLSDKATTRFVISQASSYVEVESRTTLHPIKGRGTGIRGYIDAAWDGDRLLLDPAPRMQIELPVERLNSGNAAQDAEMKKFIGSKAHPLIVAELRDVRATDQPERFRVKGAITVRGTTGEHEGQVTIHRGGSRLNVDGSEMIYIRKFGLEPPKIFVFQVNAYVRVTLHLVAELES